MSGPIAIVVRRELVEVAVGGTEGDGVAVQRHLAAHLDEVVAPSLEEVFGELDLGDDHLAIGRLAIEVESTTIAGLDAAIADAVRRQTRALLRQHASPGSPTSGSPAAGPVIRRAGARSVAEAFAWFLSTGRLPWSLPRAGAADLESAVRATWDRVGRDGSADPGWPVVRAALAARRARDRLVRQCSPAFVDEVIRRMAPAVADAVDGLLSRGGGPAGAGSAAEPTRRSEGGADRAWRRAVRLVALDAAQAGRGIDEAALDDAAGDALHVDVRAGHASETQASAERDDPAQSSGFDVGDEGGADAGSTPGRSPSDRRSSARSERRTGDGDAVTGAADMTSSTGAIDADEASVVDHAGAVLLHPFLPRLFTGLGLCDGPDVLTDPERAVCLLHHAATGEQLVPEHETTVAKVLCGMPLDEPVEREPAFTAAELDEVEGLLLSVVGHWDALRRTTPAGLRAEFLMRPGLLTIDPQGGWLLRVEQRTSDVLLGRLPWGISMVRTPWMDRMLRVEWGS